MDRRTLGFGSAAVLALGAFLPVVSVPILGSMTYFNNGQGDGVVVLLLAAASAVLVYFGRFRWLWVTGGASLALFAMAILRFQSLKSDFAANAGKELGDNPFRGLAEAMAGAVQLEWGWGVLFAGAIGLIVTAVRKGPAVPE